MSSLMLFLVLNALGPGAAISTAGRAIILLVPIAGAEAWRGTVMRGQRALWPYGLYLVLNAGTVAGLVKH